MDQPQRGSIAATASMTGYAGAAIVLLTWAAGQAHVTVPPEVAAALVMLLTPIVHLAATRFGARVPTVASVPETLPAATPPAPQVAAPASAAA